MNINKSNYETFIIDYLDGRLSADEVAELLLFVEQHDEIKEEFEFLQANKKIEVEDISFDKSGLKKPETIDLKNYEEKLVALLEGDLTENEKQKLLHEISVYPELEKEFKLTAATKISADRNIVFENKQSLKKKTGIIIPMWQRVSAVAALLIAVFFMIYLFSKTEKQVAGNVKNPLLKEKIKTHQPKVIEKKIGRHFNGNKPSIEKKENPSKEKIERIEPEKQFQPEQKKEMPIEVLPEKNIVKIDSSKSIKPELIENKPMLAENKNEKEPKIFRYEYGNPKDEADLKKIGEYLKTQFEQQASTAIIYQNKPNWVEPKQGFWSSVGLTFVNAFNKVTGKDVKLSKTYNEEGKVVNVGLLADGRIIGLRR